MANKVLMLTETISFSDSLFSCREEIEVEAELVELLERGADVDVESCALRSQDRQKEIDAYKLALLKFDRLVLEPELSAFQHQTRIAIKHANRQATLEFEKANPRFRNFHTEDRNRLAQENAALFENYRQGLRSPDLDERAKFQTFKDAFVTAKTSIPDIIPALRLFVTAKSLGGRPPMSPSWRRIDFELKQIREKIQKGDTKAKAIEAVALASNALSGGHENKVDRLRKAYKAKMKLRENT